jgi:hypothetical protein
MLIWMDAAHLSPLDDDVKVNKFSLDFGLVFV